MQIILLEKTPKGNVGDVVSVKAGYARNYLIPYGKALPATKVNLADLEKRRGDLEKQAAEKLNAANKRAEALSALPLTITAMASDEGKLYGSIGTVEITHAIKEAGGEIAKKEILLPEGPLHVLGEYEIKAQLHTDVVATIKINVVAEAK